MKNLKVNLGIARPTGNLRLSKGPNGSVGPAVLSPELKKMVFERDEQTCQCCGFKAEKYQDVHFIDNNPKNFDPENLLTLCIFCHQCFDLEQTTAMRSGVLIWLPEISQIDLHHIMRAVYVARISQGPMAEAARVTLDSLMGRREEARRRIQTDDPFVLSLVLKDFLTGKYYAERNEKLQGIRLLPLDRRLIKESDLEFNQFPQILAYWRSKDGPFGGRAPTLWTNLYKKALKELDA
ncbi:MAG TPA: type IV secretion protein DotN [Rhodospirillaceae bacterium]|nr:type IV secretion protein DotN [Rhodospirillaceae bacterium]